MSIPYDERMEHEEKVAAYLAKSLEPEDVREMDGLRISDKLILLMGRCHVMYSNPMRDDRDRDIEVKNIMFLTPLIMLQLALENEIGHTGRKP